MNHIESQLTRIAEHLGILKAFVNHPGLEKTTPSLSVGFCHPCAFLNSEDVAVAGAIFGKEGWVRDANKYAGTFTWKRLIDGVEVQIPNAEAFAIPEDGSPVPPKAFPIMIEEGVQS